MMGGGEIKVTPGVECLNLAISFVTLNPGAAPFAWFSALSYFDFDLITIV